MDVCVPVTILFCKLLHPWDKAATNCSLIPSLSAKHGSSNNHDNLLSPGQVVLLWNLQKGCAVVPKCSNPEHLRDPKDIEFVGCLSPADMKRLDSWTIGRQGHPTATPQWRQQQQQQQRPHDLWLLPSCSIGHKTLLWGNPPASSSQQVTCNRGLLDRRILFVQGITNIA